jgi:hypothetical protein
VISDATVFAVPAAERVRQREEEKRRERLARILGEPGAPASGPD